MKQRYHSNATTNIHLRSEINKSTKSNIELSVQYGVSEKTIVKWKAREKFTDKSSRPNTITYSLKLLTTVNLRCITWWSLDEIAEAIYPENPNKIRSAVYRIFVREAINKVSEKEKEKAKKFKEYDPVYLCIDVTYLPKINGVKYYLFVAIDRATRTLYYQIYDAKSAANAEDFLEKCIEFFPVYITHILTDNGLEFTNRLLKSKKGESCKTPSKFDVVCAKNNIDHRCTKPFTPKTNGMVEKANDIIKQKTIKKTTYTSLQEMKDDLTDFLVNYNLYRRHGSLRKELNVKTPFDAVVKWHVLDETIFKEKPEKFKQKILYLKCISKQGEMEQPCET